MRTWHRLAPDYTTGLRRVWRCQWCGLVFLELPPVEERTGCPYDPLAVTA